MPVHVTTAQQIQKSFRTPSTAHATTYIWNTFYKYEENFWNIYK